MWGKTPRPVDALPCGSLSTSRTLSPTAARAVPRLMVVVVLPTPPFWLAMARTRTVLPNSDTGQPPYEHQTPASIAQTGDRFSLEAPAQSCLRDLRVEARAFEKDSPCAKVEIGLGKAEQARQ